MAYGALSGDLFQMASGRRAGMQSQASGIQLPRIQAPSLINDDDDDKEKEQAAAGGIRTADPAGIITPGTDEDGQSGKASPMAAGAAGLSDMDSAIASVSNQFAIWFGDRYAFSDKEAETFRNMVAGSADPVDTAGRYIAATAIAKRTGTTVDKVYPNLDMYAKYFTGDVYRPGDATFGEKMNASFESIDIMDEMGRWMDMVQKNGFDDPDAMALEAEIMQRQEAIGGIQNGIPKGFWDSVANDVIASLGYTMEAINYGAGASLATTAATAPGVAAVTAINPFAGIAVGSTAALLAGANGAVASFNRTRKLTEADTFWNMTHLTDAEGNLLPRDINAATLYAGINGNITGFLETMADGVISRGLGAFAPSVAKRFGIPNLSMKVLTDRGVSGAASRITYAGVDFLTGGLNEGFIQEAPEQLATSVLTAIYENTVGGTPDISVKKLASEYFSTAFRSTLVGLAYGGLGIPQSMAQYDQISLDLRRSANRTPSQEAFFETTEQMKPESVSKDDYDLARTRIFESAQRDKAAMAGMSVNASEAIAEEERYSTEDPVTGEERARALPDGSVYRDPERNALYTESREENGRRAFYAGDPNSGAVYGRIGLSSDGEVLTVDDVRVRPGYEGIREEFVRSAISSQRTGESLVEWNPSTPGNRAVRDMLIQNNPRGADAGLDYGADLSVSQDHDIQGLSSSIRTAMPNLSREESVVAARLYTIADSDSSLSKLNNGQPVQQDASLSARYRGAADAAKAIIYAGQNADFSTFYHELFHVNATQRPAEARQLSNAVRSSLADEVSKANLRKFIEESKEIWGESFNADDVIEHLGTIAADSDASSWTRAQFEDLARLAEAYATADNSRRTTLPEAIRNILRKIGEYMRKVYQTVTHTVPLPKEITEAYDAIMYKMGSKAASDNIDSNTHYQDEKRALAEKYSGIVENPGSWNDLPVRNFFKAYKPQITDMLLHHPTEEIEGIKVISGIKDSEMPFASELVQSKFMKEILGNDIILLPSHSTALFNEIFGVTLRNGSIPDGLAVLTNDGKYIEYKYIHSRYLVNELAKAANEADIAFVMVDDLSDNVASAKRFLERKLSRINSISAERIIIGDLRNEIIWEADIKNKETSEKSPLISQVKRITWTRIDDSSSPTSLNNLWEEMRNVKKGERVKHGGENLVFQDAKSPDTSDFTPEQTEKRERIATKDDAFLDGEDNSYDDFYDEYEADMDAIETEQDADFYSRMYSEYEAETAAETSNTDASVTDEMHPDWKDDEVNVLPDGSVPETEAEYEEAIASEFIPDEMVDRGDAGIDAAAEAEKAGPSRSSEGGLYLTGSGDPETTWSEFISSNKPDISYADAKTDAEKDEIFIRSLQDNDNLLRYLGIAAEAMFLNTSRLNGGEDGYYFCDQMQRERIKERVTNAITNTTIRNASLQAFRGQPLSGRMASMIRREMGENARLYRNIFSYMLRDDAMKPESLIKETRGLDIPSRETLDAMPIAELRRLAATAEDQSIIDEIENGTLKLRGGADEKRAAEINSALESLAGRIREDETAIREASAANSALQNDIDSLTASMSERDKAINETMRDLQDIDAALRSGIGKLSGEQLERLSYTPRMKEISGQLAWLSESRYSEYERQRTKGKKGKYEYPRAQKEARSEYLADLSRAIPGILDSLPSGIDPETRSGFSEARKILDARMEELRGEWQNEAAGYIADLSGSVRRRSREISGRIDDAISRMDRLSKEVKRQEKLRETVKSNRVRQIYDARTEERWKAAKKMLEREKELNQRIQDWKSFASYQRKELRSEARENARSAVDDAITRERWLSSKRLHEETAKLQQEINDWKSYAEWERKDRKAELESTLRKAKDDAALLAAWMKAKGDERIKKLKEEQRAKRKEERLYRQIRAEKLKLARAISRPVNLNTTDFDTSAEAIMAIQAIVDPVFRRDWVYDLETDAEQLPGGDTMSIQNAVAYLEALSENDRASVLSVLSPELVARLTGTRNPLNDWSIAELRMLAEQVSELRRRGREVLAAKKAFERESIQRIQKSIIDAVRSTKDGDPGKSTLPGTLERMKQAQGPWANMRINKYVTMRMSELAQLLDGGLGRKGEAYHLLVDEKRYHQSREWEAADRRYSKAKPYLTKETLRNLFDTITVELDGIKRTYTIDQLCALVLTEGYADNVEAIMGGNLLDETEKGTATSHGYFDDEGKFHPEYMSPGTIADDAELENIAKSRYRKLLGIAHNETAARNLLPLIYEIRKDFNDPSNFDRLNRASIEWFNTPVKRVEGYFPIIRQDLKGESFRNDVADSIFNLNTNEANAILDKGMTIERIHISLRHQRPVDMSMLGVWQKAVRDQEHLIEYAGYHKKLKSVFGSNASELIAVVNQAYSPALMKEVQDYIDHVIDPYAGGARSQTDKAMRNLRGRVGSAYLGWKLPGVVLQFCTSAWPFLQEMGPATMLRGYLRLASGRGDAFNFVMEKSPMMKHRTMNTVLQEAMERRGEVNASKAGRALNKFEEVGQLGLTWVDKTIVFGGWLGAYEDALQRNLDAGMDTALADAAAVKTADDIVLNTQPVGDSTELPSLFRTKSEAMKIFLQFQSSLSVIWNNLVWDNIGYFRNREYGKIIRSVAAYSMAGLALGLVADGFDDDDDDADRLRKIAYWMMTQGIESFPVFGADISGILQRAITGEKDFYGSGTDMFPGITKLFSGVESIIASDKPFLDGAKKVAEGAGVLAGVPTSGIKSILRIREEGLGALLGR